MRTLLPRVRLVIAVFIVASVAMACGTPAHRSASIRVLHWEVISSTSAVTPWIVADMDSRDGRLTWYDNCTRRVERYFNLDPLGNPSNFSYPSKYNDETLWFWNGSKWQPLKTSIKLNPNISLGIYPATWNSSECKIILTSSDISTSFWLLSAALHPGEVLNPTWVFNGESWDIVSPMSPQIDSPPGGYSVYSVMIYYPPTHSVLYVGFQYSTNRTFPVPKGNSDQVLHQLLRDESNVYQTTHLTGFDESDSTWEFVNDTWVKQYRSATLPRIANRLAVYDPSTQSIVLFGGQTVTLSAGQISPPQPVYDTWLWNGTTWTQPHSLNVPHVNTSYSAMAYDPLLKGVVLYDTQSRVTWLWTGTNWKSLATTNMVYPPLMSTPSMVFDQATNQLLLTGGNELRLTKRNQSILIRRASSTWVLAGSPS